MKKMLLVVVTLLTIAGIEAAPKKNLLGRNGHGQQKSLIGGNPTTYTPPNLVTTPVSKRLAPRKKSTPVRLKAKAAAARRR